jgi:hypothetical protein
MLAHESAFGIAEREGHGHGTTSGLIAAVVWAVDVGLTPRVAVEVEAKCKCIEDIRFPGPVRTNRPGEVGEEEAADHVLPAEGLKATNGRRENSAEIKDLPENNISLGIS